MTDASVATDTQNGHAKGRTVPALPTFTFRDSGVTVAYRRFSPFMGDQIAKKIRKEKPAPQPPFNTVNYGDGKKVKEPNLADPEYIDALAKYDRWVQEESGQRLVEMVVTRAIEPLSIDQDAVAFYRETARLFDLECDDDDRMVYIRYIAIGSPEDLADIMQAVVRRSEPTSEAIQAAVDSFPGDVQGT